MNALAFLRSALAIFPAMCRCRGKASSGLTVKDLERAFGAPLVQAAFRWNLLGDVPVSTHVLAEKQDLRVLLHPWFVNQQGVVQDWGFGDVRFFIDNRPLGVLEAAENPQGLFPSCCHKIEQIAGELGGFQSPVQLSVLAYALPDGKYLLLDSNHRVACLAAKDIPFRIILHAIHGPMDPRILTDLLHFHAEVVAKGPGVDALVQRVNDEKAWEQSYAVIADVD